MKFRSDDVCSDDGENIETRGSCMTFDARDGWVLMHSVPLLRLGILGTTVLLGCNSLYICFLGEWFDGRSFRVPRSKHFFCVCQLFFLYISFYILSIYKVLKRWGMLFFVGTRNVER